MNSSVCRRAALMLLTLCVLLGAFSAPALAESWDVDFGRDCSLTVAAGNPDNRADLELANVVFDLYRVADAVADPAMYGYGYSLYAPYHALTITTEMQTDDWTALAQTAALAALEHDTPVVTGAKCGRAVTALDSGEKLKSGLYLILARSEGLTDYVVYTDLEGGGRELKTIARSPEYEYAYAPQLISLPGRDPGVSGTGEPGTWYYAMNIELKSVRDVRLGSLEIVKTLRSYRAGENASFVFSIDAVREGAVVFSDVAAMSFTDAGTRSIRIENLPAGSVVTVREIYSGACYTLASSAESSAVIVADETVSVGFANEYDSSASGGHGLVNSFTYSEGGDWSWTQGTDSHVRQGGTGA